MKPETSILALHTAHAEICAALHRDAFEEPEQWGVAAFEDLLRTPGILGSVIIESDTPAGVLLVRHCLDEAEILTIAVAPSCRRKGYARAMLDENATYLVSRGVRCLFLEVSVHNAAAIALYRALGYVDCGMRRSYYPDGSDALVMRHDLQNEIR